MSRSLTGHRAVPHLGVAVFGALIADRADFVQGMQLIFTIAASLLTLTAVAAFLILRPEPKLNTP